MVKIKRGLSQGRVLITTMSALEKLRPFFRVCQCVGIFSNRIENERKTRRLMQFSFSWRYPIVWWFTALAFIHLTICYFILTPVLSDPELNQLPTTISVSLSITGVVYYLVELSSRYWLALRFSAVRKAIKLMRQVEENLEECQDCKCTIRRRMTIGLTLNFLSV